MEGRMQNILEEKTYPQKNRTASEGNVGGQTFMRIIENKLTENNQVGQGMLEYILSPSNLNAAYLQVKRNKGAGGVDKMEVESLKDYLIFNKEELLSSILCGNTVPILFVGQVADPTLRAYQR